LADGISKYGNQFSKLSKNKKEEPKIKTQTIPHAEIKAEKELIQQTETNHKQESETKEETEQQVEVEANKIEEKDVFVDPAFNVLSIVESGKRKKKMEEERTRRTYWLLPEEIKMIDKLNKITGLNKYDVVGTAIRSMYERAMQVKNKKPDQR
jgi:hypothetical protein